MTPLAPFVLALGALAQDAVGPGARHLARFGAALQRLDAGDFDSAEVGFVLAGENAPKAPVWRASARVGGRR